MMCSEQKNRFHFNRPSFANNNMKLHHFCRNVDFHNFTR